MKKNLNIFIICNIALFFLLREDIYSIQKRILPDGSIEYFNEKHVPKNTNNIKLPSEYDHIIKPICEELKIEPLLIKSIIQIESGFNPYAISPAGAMGLMQLMQQTARYYNVKNPFDPFENINAGIRHFNAMLQQFDGSIELALAAYHAGSAAVKKNTGIPPYSSTRKYVKNVMELYTGKTYSFNSGSGTLEKRIDANGDIIIFSR